MRRLGFTLVVLFGSIIGGIISQPALGYIRGAIAQALSVGPASTWCVQGQDTTTQFCVGYNAGAAEYLSAFGGTTGQGGSLVALGTSTNIAVNLVGKGTGNFNVGNGNGPIFGTLGSAAVNSDGAVQATPSPSGASGGAASVILGNAHYGVSLNGGTNQYTAPMVGMTPATSSQACTAGQMAWDATFIYWCKATNTWLRLAGSTF